MSRSNEGYNRKPENYSDIRDGAGECRYVPDISGLSLCEAAFAYAEAGFYVLPVKPGSKSPGSVVGARWHEKSSRDPEQIRAWWSDNPDYGIAVHCGRSGAGAFDLDINELEQIARDGRPDIAEALRSAMAIQATRREGDRGHYIFRMPEDEQYGNSAGAFMRWGQFRGKNGVIIVAPTTHPDAGPNGGQYHWTKVGAVGSMPDVLRECLSRAAEIADPLTDDEFDAFLDTHPGEGCGRDRCRNRVNGPVERFKSQIAQGGAVSRHHEMVKATPWAFSEAMAGCYSAREAFGTLNSAFIAEFDSETERARVAQLGDEFMRIAKWAAAQADPERAHRNDVEPTDAELEAFWTSCPELRDMRQFARSRRVGPWAMLGVCSAVIVSSVPPYVVLPPLVGHYASLNLFVALVGKSGSIKSAAIRAAFDWLNVNPPPNLKKPGSGEGLAKCFAYVKKPKGEPAIQIGKHWSVLAEIPEVDTLTATGGRGGSTLMSELRSAWSGERLGIDYAADDKAITLHAHRYRMCMIVGVQPLRAAPIFDDVDAGTPQRFVWFPVSDPDRPKERPEGPPPVDLPAWPGLFVDDDDEGVVHFDRNDVLATGMGDRADPSEFRVLDVPDAVYTAVDEQAFAVLGDDANIDPLDGHKLLCKEKVAAAIAMLRQHKDITEHDWELAGIAMHVSDRTRADVLLTLKAEAAKRNRSAGHAAGVRKMAEAEKIAYERAKKVTRIAERIVEKLSAKNDQTLNELKKKFGADKQYVDEALSDLEAEGRISKQPLEYRGNEGLRIHLNDGEESECG